MSLDNYIFILQLFILQAKNGRHDLDECRSILETLDRMIILQQTALQIRLACLPFDSPY